MKRIKLPLHLFACLTCLALASCSSEIDSIAEEDTDTTQSSNSTTTEETPTITITINQSSGGSVIYTRDTELQTSDEKTIKTLNVYLFKYSSSSDDDDTSTDDTTTTSEDDNYYYYDMYTPEESDDQYSVDIADDLIGETVKVVLIANDASSLTLTSGATSLTTFKTSLASAVMATGDYVDEMVGRVSSLDSSNNPTSDLGTGYPMSTTALDSNGNDAVTLTAAGVDMSATMVRTMARIDIKNYVTNLSINDVSVSGTPSKSYLLDQGSLEEPSCDYVTLKPLYRYFNEYLIFNEKNSSDVESVTVTVNDVEYTYSWLKHVLYMYEQDVSSSSYPTIYISYTIAGDAQGIASIPFYGTDESDTTREIDVKRNYLYTIRLGKSDSDTDDSTTEINYDADLTCSISLEDWDYDGSYNDTFDEEVDPNTEADETSSEESTES